MGNDLCKLSQTELVTLSKLLTSKVKEYFQSSEHRKEFEEWYYTKYQKEYVWKS